MTTKKGNRIMNHRHDKSIPKVDQPRFPGRSLCADQLLALFSVAGALFAVGPAYALPQDGQIRGGTGTIAQSGGAMNINQSSNKMIVDWKQFNIAAGESVNFIQPNAQSVALNRVLGNNASSIYGSLNANGQVFLVNPNGIVFGSSAQVNAGALVASTLSISNADFMAGKNIFTRNGSAGEIINNGQIKASTGGAVALIASNVTNNGLIVANAGSVSLLAGDKITLGDNLIAVAVDKSQIEAAIRNGGLIQADGGRVVMNVQTAQAIASTLINTGKIQANSLVDRNGVISLVSSGIVNISGSVSADSSGGAPVSSVTVLGEQINLASAQISANGDAGGGTILIGGDYQGSGPLPRATLLTASTDVTISANALKNGQGGKVVLWSDSTTQFAGKIAARGGEAGGDGGLVEVSGKNTLKYTGLTDTRAPKGKTGSLLLDPADFVIAASGGDITGATIAANLASTDLKLLSSQGAAGTNGDILINDNIAYDGSGNHNLTLSAYRHIAFAAGNKITFGGSGTLLLRADNTGLGVSTLANPSSMGQLSFGDASSGITITGSGSAQIHYNPGICQYTCGNPFSANVTGGKYDAFMLINDVGNEAGTGTGLQGMHNNLSGHYVLGKNIDASATSSWNAGKGFTPVGNSKQAFRGVLYGDPNENLVIDKLSIHSVNQNDWDGTGLFGNAFAATIKYIGLTNANINNLKTGSSNKGVGGFVGTTGSYTNNDGLVLERVYVTGSITGGPSGVVGGLIGINNGYSGQVTVFQSYNQAKVNSGDGGSAGGIIGLAVLAGQTSAFDINQSYNTGAVSVGESGEAGGVVGAHSISSGASSNAISQMLVRNSYNTGAVSGGKNSKVGGLVGLASGTILTSYNAGKVSGTPSGPIVNNTETGGVVGHNHDNGAKATDVYWDTKVSGQSTSGQSSSHQIGTGKSTAALKKSSTYGSTWQFGPGEIWQISEGASYPILSWNATLASGSAGNMFGANAQINHTVNGNLLNIFNANASGGYSVYVQKSDVYQLDIRYDPTVINSFDKTKVASTHHEHLEQHHRQRNGLSHDVLSEGLTQAKLIEIEANALSLPKPIAQ
jgi:filamentous hemagglutinin family protein